MEEINEDFSDTDVTLVSGSRIVLNLGADQSNDRSLEQMTLSTHQV